LPLSASLFGAGWAFWLSYGYSFATATGIDFFRAAKSGITTVHPTTCRETVSQPVNLIATHQSVTAENIATHSVGDV
jgi:hypothetical protein